MDSLSQLCQGCMRLTMVPWVLRAECARRKKAALSSSWQAFEEKEDSLRFSGTSGLRGQLKSQP